MSASDCDLFTLAARPAVRLSPQPKVCKGKSCFTASLSSCARVCSAKASERAAAVVKPGQPKPGHMLTQHTGLPPRAGTAGKGKRRG